MLIQYVYISQTVKLVTTLTSCIHDCILHMNI